MINQDRKLKNKLARVISKAGLSWVTYSSIVDFTDNLPGGLDTACWIYDKVSKKEKVLFHKKLLNDLPVPMLVLILRHEFLHKAMYRNIKGATNHALVNIALDAAINKILFLSSSKGMVKLAKFLFPESSPERLGILSILNPSITMLEREKLDSRIKKIFDEIYLTKVKKVETTDSGNVLTVLEDTTCADVIGTHNPFNVSIPEPLTLYNKLASLLSKEQKEEIAKIYNWLKSGGRNSDKVAEENTDKKEEEEEETGEEDGKGEGKKDNNAEVGLEKEDDNKEGDNKEVPSTDDAGDEHIEVESKDYGKRILVRGGQNNNRASDNKTIEGEANLIKEILGENWSCYVNLKAYFDKYVYQKKNTDTKGLDEFISRWQTEKQIESAINSIYNEIKNKTSIDPIPIELTRTGFELVVLDVCGPDKIPLYFNEEKVGAKKKICCYFDTSPSMHSFIPFMVSIAEFFDNCEECEIAGGAHNGRYCFSEKVEGIKDWTSFIEGKVKGGCGTSFETVVRHALDRINQDEVDIIVIFTDGLSAVNPKTVEEFNTTNKKCYTIYFADPYNGSRYGWNHGRFNEVIDPSTPMSSPLDSLNGDNFTIFANTNEKDE